MDDPRHGPSGRRASVSPPVTLAFGSDRVGANEEILDVANGLYQQGKNNCLVIRTVTIPS